MTTLANAVAGDADKGQVRVATLQPEGGATSAGSAPPISIDVAARGALFNVQNLDWLTRVTSFLNYLAVLSAGILSITIGAFVSATPPKLSATDVQLIRIGWNLLSASLALSLVSGFVHIVFQARLLAAMKELLAKAADAPPRLRIVEGSKLSQGIIWVTFAGAFLCCISGVVAISLGAGHLLAEVGAHSGD